ncbi:MAG: replicative DNA helicase [Erysipelotrichaceae bacterium]|nr:replicative DNA helicase [Erysipelotrichaceae bacterium]
MKVLPHNEESERAVLGALIESNNVRNEIVNKLIESDFYGTGKKDEIVPNRLVFRAINTLMDNGKVVDVASITTELDVNMKVLSQIGGVNYIRELIDSYISDSNALYHADTIKDLALSRRLIECLDECVEGFEKKEFTDVGQYIAQCEKKILDITQARRVSEFEKASDIVDQIARDLKISRNKNEKGFKGVSTGFKLLDYYTQGGWQPGQLNIIGARPSVGKTAFSLNLAYNAARLSGGTVAFFSLEMDAKSIVKRLLSNAASINSALFANGELSDDDWLALDQGVKALKDIKLLIDDTAGQKLTDIKTKVQKLKAQCPDLCCIFIDYLGLITTNNSRIDNRQLEVSEISRQLKALAREVEVPIICLSQLSRGSEQRSATERMPKLSDLRDSGSIEQDADIVIFIHREKYQNAQAAKEKENEDPMDTNPFANTEETKINVAKNRNGKTGVLSYTFFMNIGKFVENDRRTQEE